ncbi:MAG: helix-turn-helix transcriptional regulator [Pseudarcicella sp.]|nr:helix-turn-helix transcriptional regulator [Pseudarcicella sp.]
MHFTQRELEVIKLASERKTNHEIAILLQISEKTVKRHKQNIMTKAGLNGRAEMQIFLADFSRMVL